MNLFFKPDVVGTSRFFRLQYYSDVVICDDRVKAVCETADLKGLHFLVQERPPEKPRAFPFFIKGNAHCKRGDLVAAIAAYDEAIRLGRRDTFYPLYFQTRADAYSRSRTSTAPSPTMTRRSRPIPRMAGRER